MVAKLGLFIGAAGLTATLTVAIPADAQYYPPPSNQGGILGAILGPPLNFLYRAILGV